jgi:RNA polymerase-binding transcription factor DksA
MDATQVEQVRNQCIKWLNKERAEMLAQQNGGISCEEGMDGLDLYSRLALNRHSVETLYRIERALERDRQGLYGQCERCGQPIWERLISLPYAELCIDCQRRLERHMSSVESRSTWSVA